MHKDDLMTPKERFSAMNKGEAIDRFPAVPFLSAIGPKLAGITMREARNDSRKEAAFRIKNYELLGQDSTGVDYGLHGIGIALGSTATDPENAWPNLVTYALDDLNNLDTLDLSKVERKNDSFLNRLYEAEQIILEKIGGEVGGVDFSLCGPVTAAASIYPTSLLLRAIRKTPEKVHELLRFSTEAIKTICEDFVTLGAGFTLCDPVASGTILRKEDYLEFVFPYTRELVEHFHSKGCSVTYHICGNTTKILEPMVDTGVDVLSIDNIVDIEDTKRRVGSRICIAGNVDPVKIMLEGTPEDVDSGIKQCFARAWDSPKGYILATGCGIPNAAPAENVFQFMKSARKYGRIAAQKLQRSE